MRIAVPTAACRILILALGARSVRAILALLAILAALVGSPSAGLAQTVGFAQVGSESDWRRTFTASVMHEAAARAIDLMLFNAEGDPGRQVAAVRDFIRQGVDAIVIAPVVLSGWTDVLEEAKTAAIPVFIVDRAVDADPSLYVARIAANFNLEGKLAAAWLAQESRGRCTILELEGTAGSAAAVERKRGFAAIIAEFPDMRVVGATAGNFTRAGGRAAMERLLADRGQGPPLCAVFAHNDDMMFGAIEAMTAVGLEPGRRPLTVSVDAVEPARQAVEAGILNASVELKADIGGEIFDVVQAYLKGRRDFPKWIVIASDLHVKRP